MLNKIWLFLDSLIEDLVDIASWIFMESLDALLSVIYWILDTVFTIIISIIHGIDFTGIRMLEAFDSWDLLPDQVIYILDQLSFGTCLAMLSSAYGIRLLANLIPASLTRV